MKNQYRINTDVLLQLNTNISEVDNFQFYESGLNNKQYISDKFENSNNISLDNTIWNFGEYPAYLNKTFSSLKLIDNSDLQTLNNQKIITGSLLLRQGFDWEDVFGIFLVVKQMGNQTFSTILISQMYNINDFKINADDSRELISGAFWTKHIDFCIPNFDKSLMVSVEVVKFSDIEAGNPNIGLIYNYPLNDTQYEPLIGEEPTPDYIVTNVIILNNHYLEIEPLTTEFNKTLEQSLLDYFDLKSNIIPIEISHIIKYGIGSNYKTIRVSNEDNKFEPIKLGLDFSDFLPQTTINIFVSTEILVNNKLMVRNNTLLFNFVDVLNPIIQSLLINPTTNYPVRVENINQINNTIIETKTERKIVPIFQKIYAELVTEDVVYENKNIIFNIVETPCYFVVKSETEQYILSKITQDNKYYFDLNEIPKPEKTLEYNIISATNKSLIQKGKLIVT